MRILILEDDTCVGAYLENMLEGDHEVLQTADAETAVQLYCAALVEHRPFGLLFVDITLPGMSGHEFVSLVRDFEIKNKGFFGEKTHVCMVTGSSSPDDRFKAMYKNEAQDFLVKPCSGESLNRVVARAAKGQRA